MSVIDFTRFEGRYLHCDTGKRRTNEWWQELSSETDIATISLVLYSLSRRDRAYSTDVARVNRGLCEHVKSAWYAENANLAALRNQ